MGIGFAHNCPYTQSCGNFEGVFGGVQSKQWLFPSESPPKKDKVGWPANIFIATLMKTYLY